MAGASERQKQPYRAKYGADAGQAFLGLESDVWGAQTGGKLRGVGEARLKSLDEAMDIQTEDWARKLRAEKYAVGKQSLLTGSELGISGNKPASLLK